MDIGAVLADDKTSYFVFCQQEMWRFFVKRIVPQWAHDIETTLDFG